MGFICIAGAGVGFGRVWVRSIRVGCGWSVLRCGVLHGRELGSRGHPLEANEKLVRGPYSKIRLMALRGVLRRDTILLPWR